VSCASEKGSVPLSERVGRARLDDHRLPAPGFHPLHELVRVGLDPAERCCSASGSRTAALTNSAAFAAKSMTPIVKLSPIGSSRHRKARSLGGQLHVGRAGVAGVVDLLSAHRSRTMPAGFPGAPRLAGRSTPWCAIVSLTWPNGKLPPPPMWSGMSVDGVLFRTIPRSRSWRRRGLWSARDGDGIADVIAVPGARRRIASTR